MSVLPIVGLELVEPSRGTRKGHAATTVRTQSDLTNILEEIGNSVGKLADKRLLGTVKQRHGTAVNKNALKRIADYYDKLPDAPSEDKLSDLVNRLQLLIDLRQQREGEDGQRVATDEILQTLAAADSDERNQYMLLQGARIHFESNTGADALIGLLDKVEQSFNESGIALDVRADYAMLSHASKVAPSAGLQPEVLRDRYREMLLSGMNLGQLFYTLSDLYKRLSFHAAVDVFLKAAGDDLEAVSNASDRTFLGALLKQLGILKTMRTVYESATGFLDKMERLFPNFSNGAKAGGPAALVGELLTFCSEHQASVETGRKILKPFDNAAAKSSERVVFFNGLLDLHRDMPDHAFPSHQARLMQLSVLTAVCSDLTEIEERAFEASKS
ncbi:hypothetical protein PDO_4836 [Rhizobium sp. PDO1-076]|uniref:hypothetical protein n=1 Tax=Rhizobium sp. PDO1-076 TaxID=1125979 RepID=UPI00024E3243|nr:hypothetical protein [Rhizobium sp. PDO1-076]EHS52214.1 hypothetical protein PDO_4836 [Rhizobium sp. PDO1-076]